MFKEIGKMPGLNQVQDSVPGAIYINSEARKERRKRREHTERRTKQEKVTSREKSTGRKEYTE